MIFQLEKINPSAVDGDRVYTYSIDAKLESGRIVIIFCPASTPGEKLESYSGKYVNGILRISSKLVFPFKDCPKDPGNGYDSRYCAKGRIETSIDPCSLFEDQNMSRYKNDFAVKQIQSSSSITKAYVLDTVDGLFLLSTRTKDHGEFKEGDEICCYGRIDLLSWSPLE